MFESAGCRFRGRGGRCPRSLTPVEALLSAHGHVPKHVQLREYVRALVREAQPGTAAPSERELVQQFGVARMTVRQALDALVAEGLLQRSPGRGTFVSHPRRGIGLLRGFTEEMTARGMLAESQTLLARLDQAGPAVARALDITPGDPVIRWKRLRRANGNPMSIEDAYLNEVLLPGFLQRGMPTSLYDALGARGLRPTRAEDSVGSDVASAEEATLLEVPAGAPVLRHSRRALVRDRVIEVSRTIYRADRFTFRVHLGRES
jgi:GntR family transcriptional regulator